MENFLKLFIEPGMPTFWAFLLGTLLAGYVLDKLAFALVGCALTYFFLPWFSAKTGLVYATDIQIGAALFPWLLAAAAYLVGNALPWRRLEIVRQRMYKLFFSVAGVYLLLLGAAVLLVWRLGLLEQARPWLICFSLGFFLLSCYEPWRRVLLLGARGPLSFVLPRLSALSAFCGFLTVELWQLGDFRPVLTSLAATLVFFALWLGFIRLSRQAASSWLARGLQLGFLLLAARGGLSVVLCALGLGAANALSGAKVLDAKTNWECWRWLNALVFLLIFAWLRLEQNLPQILLAAALLLAGRAVWFGLYNLFAGVYLFGRDFVRRINFGLQISDGVFILLLWYVAADLAALSAAVLAVLAEQLLYPALLKYALVHSGETDA